MNQRDIERKSEGELLEEMTQNDFGSSYYVAAGFARQLRQAKKTHRWAVIAGVSAVVAATAAIVSLAVSLCR